MDPNLDRFDGISPFCLDKSKLWPWAMACCEAVGVAFHEEPFQFVVTIPLPESKTGITATVNGEGMMAKARIDRLWRTIASMIVDQTKPLALPAVVVDSANDAYWEYFHFLICKHWRPGLPICEITVPTPRVFYQFFKDGAGSGMEFRDPVLVTVHYIFAEAQAEGQPHADRSDDQEKTGTA